ncbi:hypothetical protein QS306_05350 [Paraburkholderia bonniea]|uniref:hypothetical protein n=1 Tax=Paraburkholderia bonniea TaxID=2152891 RepID=UPI001291C5C4|nr:hypothetical protein [Paraburkholderia bonniea]WJF91076.1 hypothetical protein QS306_05350 [Paraburkholderia bonniea]WJF94391.1 hypothetical protein QS308_05355 [Paraburkholderia bonniea]
MASDYRVRVTRDNAGFDDYGIPQVTRTKARVEIVMPRRALIFDNPPALQTFINACVEAHDNAFGPLSQDAPSANAATDADQAAWRAFYARLITP